MFNLPQFIFEHFIEISVNKQKSQNSKSCQFNLITTDLSLQGKNSI